MLTRNGVVILGLVVALLKDVAQVEALKCLSCHPGPNGKCESYILPCKQEDTHCMKITTIKNDSKGGFYSTIKYMCAPDKSINDIPGLKTNSCVILKDNDGMDVEYCACNTDMCSVKGSLTVPTRPTKPTTPRAPTTTTTRKPRPAPTPPPERPPWPEQPPPPAPEPTSPGLKCYVCDIRINGPCTDEDAKEKEQECNANANENLCTKSNVEGSPMAIRGCMSLEVATYIGLKKNECVKTEKQGVNVDSCTCDKGLCNGAKYAQTTSALIATMALICSISSIVS